jgi:APA family basic amino acid/polyamine antiporter
VVTALYVGLNAVFIAAPAEDLASAEEAVAYVAAEGLFGAGAAAVVSAIIAVGLVSTVGAFVMTGAVSHGRWGHTTRDRAPLAASRGGGPVYAIMLRASSPW